ncbi:splicing factor [Linderina macrospora]|uniref:Splicing factor n=1 Tax=Linderina macrospora TaxID=4868 RepID=A0ACC1JCU3_9FUNG|nr:splicing factor [Linderina macrospora]
MTDMARQLLQELMGEYQDTGKSYTDADVCKNYLVSFCPNQLFTNTKDDLGQCTLIHDDRLRTSYQQSSDRGRLGYEQAFYSWLQQLHHDLQRKVRRAHERITAEADDALANPHREEKEERAILMDERIREMLKRIEDCGMGGRVDEALNVLASMEKAKVDLAVLRERIDAGNPMFKNEKRLEVCDVCGAFLVPNDASKRLDAHIEGKQHQGYLKIQQALETYKSEGGVMRDSRAGDRYGDSRRHGARRRDNYRQSRSRSRSPYSGRRGYDRSSGYSRDYSRSRRRR